MFGQKAFMYRLHVNVTHMQAHTLIPHPNDTSQCNGNVPYHKEQGVCVCVRACVRVLLFVYSQLILFVQSNYISKIKLGYFIYCSRLFSSSLKLSDSGCFQILDQLTEKKCTPIFMSISNK